MAHECWYHPLLSYSLMHHLRKTGGVVANLHTMVGVAESPRCGGMEGKTQRHVGCLL